MNLPRGRMILLACGAGVLVLAAILSQRRAPSTATPEPQEMAAVPSRERAPAPRRKSSPPGLAHLSALPAPVESNHPPDSPENQEWIASRIAQLDALAWQDDPGSLGKILTELTHPLPEIRAGALQATRSFGSRDAIPYLEAIANDSTDPQEKTALIDLIDHLKLPTLLEISDDGPEK